jgi:hypothetical protein
MEWEVIFKCLRGRKSVKVFIISACVIAAFYLIFTVVPSLWSLKTLPQGSLTEIILFGGLRAFSAFQWYDWTMLVLFPIVGGLSFANAYFWKCQPSKSTRGVLFIGLLAATCPACLIPILGIGAFITLLTKVSIYIKATVLLFLLAGAYFIAMQGNSCKISKKNKRGSKNG